MELQIEIKTLSNIKIYPCAIGINSFKTYNTNIYT